MSALPVSSDITAGTVTEAGAKTWLAAVRDYLNGLFGAAGTQSQALATLGVPLNAVVAKTAAYTVIATDRGAVIDCTTGTFTLTLTAAATLGDGFEFAVRNSGAGVITIDPSGSEQIDGVTTITLIAGQTCFCVCNGTAWKTVGKGGVTSVNGVAGAVTIAEATTANVLSATAGAAVGAVGTYAFCQATGTDGFAPGTVIAGSILYYSGLYTGPTLTGQIVAVSTGSWRAMGHAPGFSLPTTLFLRIA